MTSSQWIGIAIGVLLAAFIVFAFRQGQSVKPSGKDPSQRKRLHLIRMTSNFRTLDSADLAGKRVLVRVDLNVPMENGRVTDITRIERVAPTIRRSPTRAAR